MRSDSTCLRKRRALTAAYYGPQAHIFPEVSGPHGRLAPYGTRCRGIRATLPNAPFCNIGTMPAPLTSTEVSANSRGAGIFCPVHVRPLARPSHRARRRCYE
jgi:hypothetical protein